MQGSIVWGVIWMIVVLLVCVSVSLVYIFKYDDWYPNPLVDERHSDGNDAEDAGVEVRAEQNSSGGDAK